LTLAFYNLAEDLDEYIHDPELARGKEFDKKKLSKKGEPDDKNITPAGLIKELLQLFSETMLPGQLDPEINEKIRLYWISLFSVKGLRSIEILMEPLFIVSGIGGIEFKVFYEKMAAILYSSKDRFPEMISWINVLTGEKKQGLASKKLMALMERAGIKELLAEQKRRSESGLSPIDYFSLLESNGDNEQGMEDEDFSFKDRELEKDMEEGLYIKNAGLVILWHFLPAFFTKLGLVNEKKKFIDIHHQEKALLMTQYLVEGRDDYSEPSMLLNKVLCGWTIEEPLQMRMPITDEDRREAKELLSSVIGHWEALGKTSVDGFRESFLKRDGRLFLRDSGWHLLVERKGLDILLDKLPWGINPIRLNWMDRVLFVEW
jgi:hypothetical protein